MSDKIEIITETSQEKIQRIKKTSQEKIALLLKQKEENRDKGKKIEDRLKTIKSKESKIERKQRANNLIQIGALLAGDNWKEILQILITNPDKVERIKKVMEPISGKL